MQTQETHGFVSGQNKNRLDRPRVGNVKIQAFLAFSKPRNHSTFHQNTSSQVWLLFSKKTRVPVSQEIHGTNMHRIYLTIWGYTTKSQSLQVTWPLFLLLYSGLFLLDRVGSFLNKILIHLHGTSILYPNTHCMVCLPTFTPLNYRNVGKYTRPIECLGQGWSTHQPTTTYYVVLMLLHIIMAVTKHRCRANSLGKPENMFRSTWKQKRNRAL